MGFGFRLNLLKSGIPLHHSHWQAAASPSQLSSTSVRGREGSFNSARLSFLAIISEEGDISGKDTLKVYSCSPASPQILEDGVSEMEQISFRSSSSNTTGNKKVDNDRGKVTVRSGKKEERRSRKRALDNARVSSDPLPPKLTWEGFNHPTVSSAKRASKYRKSRLTIAKNEAEMSTGVKVIANLERIKATLEKETGTVATLSCWAEAAGFHDKYMHGRRTPWISPESYYSWVCIEENGFWGRPKIAYTSFFPSNSDNTRP